MQNSTYYQHELRRPRWAPPAKVFAPVWTVLYILIAISFGVVILKGIEGTLPIIVIFPFLMNLAFNILYTPIQFGLKNNMLASIDIVLVLGTLIWALISIYPFMHWVLFINIPYLLWVSFATVLQFAITRLNR